MQASTWHDYSGLPVGFLAELQMNLKYEDPCVSEARHADMAQMLFQFWAQGTPVKTSTSTYVNYTGWWFGTLFLFFHILGLIIPTDFHIFQRGWNHQPDIIWLSYGYCMVSIWLLSLLSLISIDYHHWKNIIRLPNSNIIVKLKGKVYQNSSLPPSVFLLAAQLR